MPVRRDVVVRGAAAGGVEALRQPAGVLPADFPAAILVVVHLAPGATSALPQILDRAGPLPAVVADHGRPLTAGTIHVAPPGRHLLIEDGAQFLSHGPTESGDRPAVNATFRSAAVAAGPAATGVVLSGALDDGALGLCSIVERGGVAMVQDPADALYPGMPESALARTPAEHVHPVGVLDELVRTPVPAAGPAPPSPVLLLEDRIARDGIRLDAVVPDTLSPPSGHRCPDCGGVLVELGARNGYYRCRIGHAWSAEALLGAHDLEFERALWTALRSLDEKVAPARRMQQSGGGSPSGRYETTVRECVAAAGTLRRFPLAQDTENGRGHAG